MRKAQGHLGRGPRIQVPEEHLSGHHKWDVGTHRLASSSEGRETLCGRVPELCPVTPGHPREGPRNRLAVIWGLHRSV